MCLFPVNVPTEKQGAPQLKHPIIGLRASADEVSLVIGASQLINFVAGQLWKWTIQIGAGMFLRLLDRSQNTWPKYILFLGSAAARVTIHLPLSVPHG